jgi:hypothetical protein
MAVTDVPLTLGVAASLALLVSGRIELAGVAAGVAMGFKYPGIFLLVPIGFAGWRQPRRLAVAVVAAFAVFALTNPFFVAHLGTAVSDAYHVQQLSRQGWLGFEHDHAAPLAFLYRLWDGLGPVLIVCGVGLGLALVRRERNDLILASFVVVYFLELCTLNAHWDRYILPLVPPLAALAGRIRGLAPVTLLLLVVPLTWTIRDDRRLTKTDTREVAHAWVESHVPRGAHVAADPSLTPFAGYRVLQLRLPLPQEKQPDPNRDIRRLRNQGVRYAIVTGAIADRVQAARGDYPVESAFYDKLGTLTKRLYYVQKDGLNGPWVAVYRL